MKYFIIILITLFMNLYSNTFAFNGEKVLIDTLIKGKTINEQSSELVHTKEELSILKNAYKELFHTNKDFPACEVMKLSIDLKYNPYNVLKTIYSIGKEIELDQLCMCATETGINKAIIARAVIDATDIDGNSIYERDEVNQSQCLRLGLGYTSERATFPVFGPIRSRQTNYSAFIPK